MGLGDHIDVLIDGTQTIDALIARANRFKEDVDRATENAVRERLNTGINHVPTHTKPTAEKQIKDMTDEEYVSWKKDNGIG